MSAFQALDAARAAGVKVRLDGKNLAVSAASEPPTDILDMLRRHKRSIAGLLQPTQPWDRDDWLGFFDERAAIAEYDGGLSRLEAEKLAYTDCLAEWLYRHPVDSKADAGCLVCNQADRPSDDLLPVGLGGGQVWLHRECSAAWSTARKAEAVAALHAMGIAGPVEGGT